MNFKAAKCPNCHGDLQVPDNRDVVKCMYCGNDIVVREALRLVVGVDVTNTLKIAQVSLDAGNTNEAYGYYAKILESDITNAEAWFGKGMAAGKMSTIANPRLEEAVINFEKAIEYAEEKNQNEYREKAAKTLTSLATSFYEVCNIHYIEFIDLDNALVDFANNAFYAIAYLERAYNICKLEVTIDWILYISNNTLFRNTFSNYKTKYYSEKINFNKSTEVGADLLNKPINAKLSTNEYELIYKDDNKKFMEIANYFYEKDIEFYKSILYPIFLKFKK